MSEFSRVNQFLYEYLDTVSTDVADQTTQLVHSVNLSGFYENVTFIETTQRLGGLPELRIFGVHSGRRSPFTQGFEQNAIQAASNLTKLLYPCPIVLFEQAPRTETVSAEELIHTRTEELKKDERLKDVKELFHWKIPQY
jgi:hypothetical protein